MEHIKSGVQTFVLDFLLDDAPPLSRPVEVDSDQIGTLIENSQRYTMLEQPTDSKHSNQPTIENHLHQLGYVNPFDVWSLAPNKGVSLSFEALKPGIDLSLVMKVLDSNFFQLKAVSSYTEIYTVQTIYTVV